MPNNEYIGEFSKETVKGIGTAPPNVTKLSTLLVRYFDNLATMENAAAIESLAALAQETRLEVFRLLVKEGPEGLSAGTVARRLAVPPATLSSHFSHLEAAGLITRKRESRRIIYAADYSGIRQLLAFLTQDCCGGRPEICGALAYELVAACAAADVEDGRSDAG